MSINTAELESYWMPFTANQDFKKNPRIMVGVNVPLPVSFAEQPGRQKTPVAVLAIRSVWSCFSVSDATLIHAGFPLFFKSLIR